jgi:hypothetical protein
MKRIWFGTKMDLDCEPVWSEEQQQFIYPQRPRGFWEWFQDFNRDKLSQALAQATVWLWDKLLPYICGILTVKIFDYLKQF